MSEETEFINLKPDQLPVPVVAIGASAGGQQAVSELLRHLPANTGLAFVYIQHLAPDYDSHLDMILSLETDMPVNQAAHLMLLEPDHLYIIPPNEDMEVVDGVLLLVPRKPRPQLHLPIDQFFISLAERQKDGAIGIVLSGMASDGTLGLKAIKVAGGITFAQDQSAIHQSMPQSAIAEGVVDMILSPAEIAAELVRLSANPGIFQLKEKISIHTQEEDSDEDLGRILAFVKSEKGADFKHYKKTTIRRRIIRRMLLYKLETLGDYLSHLKEHPAEAGTLYNDLLINVTSFFRDHQTMDHVKTQILPLIVQDRAITDTIRIWIAGCSTGQEAYSIAMMLTEILGERAASTPIQIFATDLSETAIAHARLGIYTKGEVANISQARLDRFFTKTDTHYRICKPVRDLCIFAPHNLLSDPPFSRLDLISCRNLLIYLDDMLQKKLFATFHYALKPDGFLLLGKSESVGNSPAYFVQTEKTHKIFARKNNTQAKIPLDMTFRKNTFPAEHKITTLKTTDVVTVNDLDKLVDTLLLTQYVPASVVVDQDLEIIQFRGSTGIFLQHSPGKASLNLTKMAHPSMVFEFRNIIHKARQSGQSAKKNGLEIKSGRKTFYANIEAVPITNPSNQQLFLVLFEEVPEETTSNGKISGDSSKLNRQLEAELTALRQDMHSIIEEQEASNEELQSANEEIVSSNEELQSINEELETSKEEIEAANEELQTINQELQFRNDQLTESYEYSEAILSTIKEATLVLDEQLRVKIANKAFYRIFDTNAKKTEGTSLNELSNGQLNFDGFRDLLYNVISRNETIEGFEVNIRISESDVRTMVIHARKVAQHQKEIILLVFEDITGHRKAQDLLHERQQWFEDLVDNAPAMIWVSQADGKITFLNKAWIDYTGRSQEDKNSTFLEAIHEADLEAYRETFALNVSQQKAFSSEYRLCRNNGDFHWVLENAKPMFSSDGKFNGYIGSSTDIHAKNNNQKISTNT